MSRTDTPFEQTRELLGEISLTNPESRFSRTSNERGVFNRRLPDGTVVHMSLASEGGTIGGSGDIIGRIHIGEGNDWHIYELHEDERVWEFAKTEGSIPSRPVTSTHWLDESEKQSLFDRLANIQTQLE